MALLLSVSPVAAFGGSAPSGATARCKDGSYSFSKSRSGTCSHHGGVASWLTGSGSASTSSTAGTGAGATAAPSSGSSDDLSLIVEPDQGYDSIYALLSSAKHELDLTMYEFSDSSAEQTLAADVRHGVSVRVLLDKDYIGSYNQPTFAYLQAHGVQVRWASSQVAITHEKSLVIDRKTTVILTGNLTSRYYSTTRDFAVVDRNAADVSAVEQTFDLDWADKQGTPGSGSDLVWSPGSEQTLVSLIDSAQTSLMVENEEMSASSIVTALAAAARRGVDVQLTMTRSSEWDDNLDTLERAGVHVRTYSPSSPLYIHAKVIDVDHSRVFIGSENFSVGSMQYNRELGLITSSPTIRSTIERTLTSDFAHAQAWQT